jgi:uncharacterized protein involved in exopolysaccharide biosynthesis
MATELSKEPQTGLLAQAQHYWHVILKWKWTAMTFLLTAVTAATIYSFSLTPVFTANGCIWIEGNTNILPFEDLQSFGAGSNLQSHARLLQSRTLAADIIEKMKLYENPDFAGKLNKGQKAVDPADPIFREVLVQNFLANISVSSVGSTQLVDVRFSSRSPKLAADILNALFDGYINMIVSKRYAASEQATEFLNTQIAGLRTEIEEKERELNKYGSEKDILPLTAAEAPTVSRMGEVNSALTRATLDRVNKLSAYNQLKAAPLGEIPSAPEGSLIQRLREQYINLSREYATRLTTVRPEFPAMERLKSEVDAATEALKNETQNLIRNAYNDYQNALSKEQSLQRLLDIQKNEAYRANSNSVVYNSLRIELDNKKSLLESLSKRQSETDVSSRLKGLEALNVWIVDKADYPLRKAFPNKRKNVLMGFFFGLAGGIGLALGLEFLNQTVKTSKDITGSIWDPDAWDNPLLRDRSKAEGPESGICQDNFYDAGERRKKRGQGLETREEKDGPIPQTERGRRRFRRQRDEEEQDRAHRHSRTPINPSGKLPLYPDDSARFLAARENQNNPVHEPASQGREILHCFKHGCHFSGSQQAGRHCRLRSAKAETGQNFRGKKRNGAGIKQIP